MIQRKHKKGSVRIASALTLTIVALIVNYALKNPNWKRAIFPEKKGKPMSSDWTPEASENPPPTQSSTQPQETAGYLKFWTGIPKKQGLTVLSRSGHTNGFDPEMMSAAWTGYIVYKQMNPTSQERPSEFQPDMELPRKWQTDPSEYTHSGYDRGHMAPNWAVSINFGRIAQVETFYMSNIAPQSPELNRGIWASVEKVIANDYARRYGEVIVFVGPLFTNGPKNAKGIGQNGRVKIPDGFYQIIVRDRDLPQALAIIFPQNSTAKRKEDLKENMVTIREIETLTGINFLPGLPNEVQERVENTRAARMW